MATVEYWIQIENHAWDLSPHNIDRMHGQTMEEEGHPAPTAHTLTSPETGVVRNPLMFNPLGEDALILRRYTESWAAPDDRKVNAWDLNEPDPTDNGTMGTIPGPVIECNVGDQVVVHFRNKDLRAGKNFKERAHSLHPHGFVFDPRYDGAFPLSPPDLTQPVAGEALWDKVGVTGFKKGDRIPPNGKFTYHWHTFGWPTTAGVWLYHDHSFCDTENVKLGAIGLIVIHNEADPDDVIDQDLPGGQPNGALTEFICFDFPFENVRPLPFDLDQLVSATPEPHGPHHELPVGHAQPHSERAFRRGDVIFELDDRLELIHRLCLRFYVDPPQRAQHLQLYHEMTGAGMTINGRKYLGNTPTLLAGLETKMRFGLVGMNEQMFHTFHLHGHRWSEPDGRIVDNKTFGPADSFSFELVEDNPGRWFYHCHVFQHLHQGMNGWYLVS
jgi:hypothetical protein